MISPHLFCCFWYMLCFFHRNLESKSGRQTPEERRAPLVWLPQRGFLTDWVGSWPQVAKEFIGDLLHRSLEDQHEIIGDTGIS